MTEAKQLELVRKLLRKMPESPESYIENGSYRLVITDFDDVIVRPSLYHRIEKSKRAKHGRQSSRSLRRAEKTLVRLCQIASRNQWVRGKTFPITPK